MTFIFSYELLRKNRINMWLKDLSPVFTIFGYSYKRVCHTHSRLHPHTRLLDSTSQQPQRPTNMATEDATSQLSALPQLLAPVVNHLQYLSCPLVPWCVWCFWHVFCERCEVLFVYTLIAEPRLVFLLFLACLTCLTCSM